MQSKLPSTALCFVGEGNCSLVVSLLKEDKVLRIKKCFVKKNNGQLLHQDQKYDEIEFKEKILTCLFNSFHWIDKWEYIYLSEDELKTISQVVDSKREEHRLIKSIPLHSTKSILMPNYCVLFGNVKSILIQNSGKLIGPTIAIELKPKKGYLPKKEWLSDDFSVFSRVCKFAMKQIFKQTTGQTKGDLSQFCPLDLFSGDKNRMHKAICNLIECPRNNFRVFCDQRLCYAEDLKSTANLNAICEQLFTSKNLDFLIKMIIECLLRPLDNSSSHLEVSSSRCEFHKCQDYKSGSLSKSCILGSILSVQHLDDLGTEKAKTLQDHFNNRYKNEFEQWKKTFDEQNLPFQQNTFNDEITWMKQHLEAHLYAQIAFDCSVMITLQKCIIQPQEIQACSQELKKERAFLLMLDENVFVARVSLMDLDKKLSTQIDKNFKNDSKLIKVFMQKTS